MSDERVAVATFTSSVEAELAKGLLLGAGIEAVLSSDDCGGMRPELQVAHGVDVLVPRSREAEARRLLDERTGGASPGEG